MATLKYSYLQHKHFKTWDNKACHASFQQKVKCFVINEMVQPLLAENGAYCLTAQVIWKTEHNENELPAPFSSQEMYTYTRDRHIKK